MSKQKSDMKKNLRNFFLMLIVISLAGYGIFGVALPAIFGTVVYLWYFGIVAVVGFFVTVGQMCSRSEKRYSV